MELRRLALLISLGCMGEIGGSRNGTRNDFFFDVFTGT
jgi:hypothetical protein